MISRFSPFGQIEAILEMLILGVSSKSETIFSVKVGVVCVIIHKLS